jgi:DNA-binding transcriptional regulator YhcF (GntR family)
MHASAACDAQIASAVRREVAAGRVRPGERLPGARELAALTDRVHR